MIHKFKLKTCLWLALYTFSIFSTTTSTAQGLQEISIEDIYKNNRFAIKSVPGFNALKDGKRYTQIDESGGIQSISIYHIASGKKQKELLTHKKSDALGTIESYVFSNDEKKLLLFTQSKPIYRRSATYKVWLYDLVTHTQSLIDTVCILHASFNPQGNKVAFVKNNNLYIKDLITDQIEAITHDGKQNHIINGNCDWVYEEEWEFSQAYQWSPKGSYIAYYRFDESQVKEYNMPFYNSNNTYPSDYKYKYPKAGEANAIVSIKIFNVEHKNTITADIGSETDQYIPRIKWTTHNEQLCIYRMNRLQNHLDLLLTEASTGHSATIYQEDNKYYVPVDDNIAFIPNTTAFIFTSEKSGYTHLYHYDWTQQSMTQLTNGNWEIDNIIGIDVPHKTVYFTAGIAHPTERQLYSINWINKKMETLTHQPGVHQITPCIGYQYFVDKHSGYNNVPIYTLINNKGAAVRVLEDNKTLQETLNQYNLSPITTLQIPNGKGEMLNAWMIKPPHFSPDKKYPVLLYQYSGPGSQEVMDKFPVGNYFWHQMLAQKGYIIVCADGTGTGGRGEAFKKKTYLQLGKLESDDQIAVGKYMAQQHYVDAARIGIWGWSFGGFMSSICIMKGNEVFKTAISVAPVTNWRYYDNIYTERYMRTPKENAAGYDENAPEKMAKLLKGNLLIIHGTADDNVHFQNAIMLTDELIKANKQFESEYYPNKNHGIYGGNTRQQLYQRMTNYILKNL